MNMMYFNSEKLVKSVIADVLGSSLVNSIATGDIQLTNELTEDIAVSIANHALIQPYLNSVKIPGQDASSEAAMRLAREMIGALISKYLYQMLIRNARPEVGPLVLNVVLKTVASSSLSAFFPR